MKKLAPVYPFAAWDGTVAALGEVIEKTGASWSVDDVREALETGSAIMFAPCDEEGGASLNDGFVILRGTEDPDGTRVLLVWIAWSKTGSAVVDYWQDIKEIARTGAFQQIEFRSPRPGWQEIAKRMGMRPVTTIYRGDA